MKKFYFVLCIVAVVFTGCKKDTSTAVKINTTDLSRINGQLKGLWLFPVETQKVVDTSGKPLTSAQYIAAPAMQFDGGSKVNILQDLNTTLNGTYKLSTSDGYIYLDVFYPDGTDINYQLLFVDGQTLKLTTSAPNVYYNGNNPEPASSVSSIVLKKQNSADITGNIVRVTVVSDTLYSVGVYVTHTRATAPADTAILMDGKTDVTGTYNYSFPTHSGDKLTVDIAGDYTKVNFYAYYNGVPMAGNVGYYFKEIKTTTGWTTP